MHKNDTLSFSKMSGTGNDFMVIDNLTTNGALDWPAFARRYCARRTSVGADGVMVLEPHEAADFRLRIFNADGSEAEMCGNGARCAAAFALERGLAPPAMRFMTLAGLIEARAGAHEVAIKMTPPQDLRAPVDLEIEGQSYAVAAIDTGVPHAIVFHDDIATVPLERLGRAIRFDAHFAPAGTNVDLVQIVAPDGIRVRTYERGVEAETLACGTGAVASAILSHRFKAVAGPPVRVHMPGGDLRIEFSRQGDSYTDAWLIGPAETIYTARLLQPLI